MSDSLYRLYLTDTMNLARSLVIKSEATADAINTAMAELNIPVNYEDPYSWKYYLNLNGQYHTHDEVMYVTSIDTLEEIAFTKETLAIHKATKGLYGIGGSYYNALVERYPNHRTLIHGILNPVDLSTAVEAVDMQILTYDSSLVEAHESHLIPNLQTWIYSHARRWNLREYEVTDNLFAAAYLAGLFAFIPNKILSLRLDMCFTNQTHSYHIWTYLRGKGRLDRFRRSLTTKQALFLYRNIRYIQENAGKQSTLNVLVDRLLTERSIPLYGFDLKHNIENMPEDSITPDVEVIRSPVNNVVGPENSETYSVLDVMEKTALLAVDNSKAMGERSVNLEEDFKYAKSNSLVTKTLESVVISTSAVVELDINDILAINWLHLAHRKIFVANLLIANPHTGEVMQVDPLEAFILYLYAYNRSIGSQLTVIPKVAGNQLLKHPMPELDELKSIVEPRFWRDDFQDVLDAVPQEDRIINNVDFYDYCDRHYKLKLALLNLHKHHPRLHGQAQWRNLQEALEYREEFTLTDTETYDEWLSAMEIDIEKISQEDAKTLADNIVTAVTGVDESEALTPRVIQSDLIDIIDELTSYNIQFIKTVVDSDSFLIDINKLRQDNLKQSGADERFVHISLDTLSVAYQHLPKGEKLYHGILDLTDHTSVKNSFSMGNPVHLTESSVSTHYRYRIPHANLRFKEKD